MIVGALFEGDDDMEVALIQHDVYHQALNAIIGGCNRLTLFAKTLLDDKSHANWGGSESCDHRTLQGAHDILAAAWRFRKDLRQAELPFDRRPEPLVPHTPENLWLWWLRQEVESWVGEPHLIQQIQIILANQNQTLGYIAESRLSLQLLNRFSDVPWDRKWQKSNEDDLERYLDCLRKRQIQSPRQTEEGSTANGRPGAVPPVT